MSVSISASDISKKSTWFQSEDIRPYVFVRPENQIAAPGTFHHLDWFKHDEIYKNPLALDCAHFADIMYSIEERAFGPSNMAMPRWVFYDCAAMPGFVAGFAARPSALSPAIKKVLDPSQFLPENSPLKTSTVLKPLKALDEMDWVPLSLFIIIPTMKKGEWVAHNLCSVNSLLPRDEQLYGLGFLSKAFGLWYANVEQCSGMTQWGSPALRLHSHYGHLEVIGAYSPVHSHAKTITYRVQVNTQCWEKFFSKEADLAFLEKYGPTGESIDPVSEDSMLAFQKKIEAHKLNYFLSAHEIANKSLKEPLSIYSPKRER